MTGFPLRAEEVAAIVGGELVGDCPPLQRVAIDTRVPMATGELFVALAGPRFDAGVFVEEAWENGASCVIVQKSHASATLSPPDGAALIRVDDSLRALQSLAAAVRDAYSGRVVAITGSNGKTTVKELLRSALGDALRVYASPLSWNSQVGVAMTLLQLDMDADVALIECGISKPGEMARLAAMVRPELGVFVNVGDAHRDTLVDAQRTAREKATLFAGQPRIPVFVPANEQLAVEALREVGASVAMIGAAPQTTLWEDDATALQVGDFRAEIPPTPVGLRPDVELAVAVAASLGVASAQVSRGLRHWAPAPMRLEMTVTPQGVFVLNDAYSADPESFDVALRSLNAASQEGRAFAVVGPLAQLGLSRARAHARVGRACAAEALEGLVLVGEAAADIGHAAIEAGLPADRVHAVSDATEAALFLEARLQRGDRVLVKASRPERLERVVALLFQAFGPTVAHIDLEALAKNLDRMRARIGSDVAVMPVVKSFGYGLDSVRLGRLFVQHGAEALAVAYADEGMLLRARGVKVPILVQNALPHELDKIVAAGLSAEVAEVETVKGLAEVAARRDVIARVHLKVDTGMGRSGLTHDAAMNTVRAIAQEPRIELEGIMTHLASSDEPSEDAFTRAQLARFADFVAAARAEGLEPRWVHAANTAGAVRFPEARLSMVRAGIGLLGYAELDEPQLFQPVMRLTTRVIGAKWMQPGEPVGYGSTWRVPDGKPRRIAVVAVGYNDGYPRHLSNKGWMSIAGVRCPVVGRVCMDVTMLDTTDVPGPVNPGDIVVVYGGGLGEPTLREMAARADTIGYELLTRISPRVRRIFVGEISGTVASG